MAKKMWELIALKPMVYQTRRLLPNDRFEMSPYLARQYVAVKMARRIREFGKIAPPPPQMTIPASSRMLEEPKPVSEELITARLEYQTKIGRKPFHGWDVATLTAKIAEAAAPARDPD